MVAGLLYVFVTALVLQNPAGQNPPAQTENGFRAASPTKTVPPDPSKALTPEMRGDIYMARKMYREAAETYLKGAKDSAVLANKTGIAYHQMLELDMARKYYQLAMKLDPHYAEAINNLGTVYYARKSYRRAILEYKRALRLQPKSASIMSNLGTAYFARKNYKEASALYQQALELDPEVFERRSSQGVLLQDRSVEERAKYHFYMAKTYAKAGQTERALLYIRKSLEEGFKDRDKFQKDPDFAGLQDNPEFKLLMATEQKVL